MAIKALTFDTFGTLVDWRSAIIEEMEALGTERGIRQDWIAFTNEWKACYRLGMDRVNSGEIPWTNVDAIYRERLNELLPRYGLDALTEEERNHVNTVWCRPRAWADSAQGLARLKSRYVLSTLSNGNFAWLVAIAKHCNLPFDCILTAENARVYKPDPKVYRTAIELLGCAPNEILMVAAHNYDLASAREEGMRTAFFPRQEHGPGQTTDQEAESDWDFVAKDLNDLADQLGC